MNQLQSHLTGHGVRLLAAQVGHAPPDIWTTPETLDDRITLAERALLGTERAARSPRDGRRASIFTVVERPTGVTPFPTAVARPPLRPLEIASIADTFAPDDDGTPPSFWRADEVSAEALWREAEAQFAQVTTETSFETVYYLFARYGWSVRGTLRDPAGRGYGDAISVFEQWAITTALAHCLDPKGDETQQVLLVGGDLPGIQELLYTITSQGAAKSLRSRSLYLQLVNDAVVRAILRTLDLPWANVVFSAGGNFRLLVPHEAADALEAVRRDINRRLLDLHRGELAAAIAWVPIRADRVADTGTTDDEQSAREVQRRLAEALAAEKQRAFADVAQQHYVPLFAPQGKGGPTFSGAENSVRNYCEVCHVELDPERRETHDGVTFCAQCYSFGADAPNHKTLAKQLADATHLAVAPHEDPVDLTPYMTRDTGNAPWDVALRSLGFDYRLIDETDAAWPERGTIYALNRPDFAWEPDAGAGYGFHFIATLSPRSPESEDNIRDVHEMADDAAGFARYGVLRMDVDGLGQALTGTRLRYNDVVHVSALSTTLTYFFEGALNTLCRRAAQRWRERVATLTGNDVPSDRWSKVPYVIYAGGDDLFLVGPWDVLPAVARHLQQALAAYTANRLTISGGISLGTAKFPLYQAADMAHSALDESKDREVRGAGDLVVREKNALTFLQVSVGWEEWTAVQQLAYDVARLVAVGDGETAAPRQLLQTLGVVAHLYQDVAEERTSEDIVLGEWVWALHYGLRRSAERIGDRSPAVKRDILGLAQDALNLKNPYAPTSWTTVRYLDLAVRWAEFLTRSRDEKEAT